jgi:hypothetical protein
MRSIVLMMALLTALVQEGNAALAQDVVLSLPRLLAAGETAWIEVQVGPIGRQEIDVTTASGRHLGVISPFSARTGQDAGTYALPVPPDAIQDNHITVRITITQSNRPPRVPTAEEVRSVKLNIAAASH